MAPDADAAARTASSELQATLLGAGGDFAWRILRLLNVSRWTLSVALGATFVLIRDPPLVGSDFPSLAIAAMTIMFAVALIEFVLLRRRLGSVSQHVYCHAIVDIVSITLLLHSSGGISSGYGGLLVVSIPSLSLLVKGDRAFLLAAFAALALLFEQFIAEAQGLTDSAAFAATGILGGVIFTIVGVTQILRRQLVETEALAEQRGVDLRNLVELNDYIIQHLRESIVVVDGGDRVRLINESAIKQLRGGDAARGVGLRALSAELATQLRAWRTRKILGDGVTIPVASSDGTSRIEPHFARLGPNRDGGVLIFLEDTSLIAERVQQTKLAALGRLSASIAHEIRNPLGALSHASQLLAETPSFTNAERRLTDIIRVNAGRVSHIVESILSLSRGDTTQPETLQLKPWAADFAHEFVQTLELFEGAVSVGDSAQEIDVEVDATHLHQIVWNLCDNAVKYASEAAGAIAVELTCGQLESGRPFLEVADRGAGITAEQAEHIFEPFFTAQPGGTGLGLYISRELCERNGGSLRYYPRAGGGSVFRIVFADPNRWQRKSAAS